MAALASILLIVLLSLAAFVGLYAGTRANVERLRERLDEAWEDRDDAIVQQQAAEAKAEHLARLVAAMAGSMPDDEAYLIELEADLGGDIHGLAAIPSANDIAEEQA